MLYATLYDIAVLVILILFAIRGYKKGLVYQLGGLIAIIVGIIVSVRYTPPLAQNLTGKIPFFTENSNESSICSFVILMVFSTLIVWGIINFVGWIVNRLVLEGWNNQMGLLIGVAHGAIWVIVLTFVLWVYVVPLEKKAQTQAIANSPAEPPTENSKETSQNPKPFILQSKLGTYTTEIMLRIIDILPKPQAEHYQLYVRLREYINSNIQAIKDDNPDIQNLSSESSKIESSEPDSGQPMSPNTASAPSTLPNAQPSIAPIPIAPTPVINSQNDANQGLSTPPTTYVPVN